MGETKKVLTELKNGVLIVTINREERRNAIDPETSAMMEQILNDAEQIRKLARSLSQEQATEASVPEKI